MRLFGFGKSYSRDDLQKEVKKLQDLYRQAIGIDSTNKSRAELRRELSTQLHALLEVCEKGGFNGMESVEWCPSSPSHGCYTSLRNVIPPVQVLIEMM